MVNQNAKQPVKHFTPVEIIAYGNANCSPRIAKNTTAYQTQNKRSVPVSNAEFKQKKLSANKHNIAVQKAKRDANAKHLANILEKQQARVAIQQAKDAALKKVELAAKRKAKRAAVKADQINNVSKPSKPDVASVARIVKQRPSAHYIQTLAATNKLRAKINMRPLSSDEFSAWYRRHMRNLVTFVALTNNVVLLQTKRSIAANNHQDFAA